MSDQTSSTSAYPGEEYQYIKITDREQDVIRLAVLQPSDKLEAGLECSLVHKSLADCDYDLTEHYVALSYVWGNPADTRKVHIEGKAITITASLDLALRHIRDKSRVMYVWADGICINQKDHTDRNHQVPLMGGIYSRARHTLIFLGLASKETDFVHFVLSHCHSKLFTASSTPESRSGYSSEDFVSLVESSILSNKWFTRIWILQEFVLSKDPWLQCGLSRVRWDKFCSILSQAGELQHSEMTNSVVSASANRSLLNSMISIREEFNSNDIDSKELPSLAQLLDILHKRRGLGVTDPRDMIYAHIGLTSSQDCVIVDYDKSDVQVYVDFALLNMRKKLRSQGEISFLAHIEAVGLIHRDRRLPSWVPDWMSPYRPQSQLERDRRNYVSLSTSIPGVLGLIGWSRGYVQSFILKSMCSELTAGIPTDSPFYSVTEGDPSLSGKTRKKEKTRRQEKLLRWMSSSEGLDALRIILRSYSTMISRFPNPESYLERRYHYDDWASLIRLDSFFPLLFPLIQKSCFPHVYSMDPTDTKAYHIWAPGYDKPDTRMKHQALFFLLCVCLITQVEHIAVHDEKTHIAILNTGEIIEVPLLTRIGDNVVTVASADRTPSLNFSDNTSILGKYYDDQHLILTSATAQSTVEEQETMMRDLIAGELHRRYDSRPRNRMDWETFSPCQIKDWHIVAFFQDTNGSNIHGDKDYFYAKSIVRFISPFYGLKPDVFAIR